MEQVQLVLAVTGTRPVRGQDAADRPLQASVQGGIDSFAVTDLPTKDGTGGRTIQLMAIVEK